MAIVSISPGLNQSSTSTVFCNVPLWIPVYPYGSFTWILFADLWSNYWINVLRQC